MFRTEAVPGLNGRSLAYPRGKVLGGSSAINAMIYIRGQSADYDHWRQLGLTRLGLGRRAADLPQAGQPFPRRQRASYQQRRVARGASAPALGHHRCVPRGGGAIRHSEMHRLQHRRQRGLRLFPRQPEARAALVVRARIPQAGSEQAESAGRDRMPCGEYRLRRQARDGNQFHSERRAEIRALPRRGDFVGRRDRLGAAHAAFRR